MTPAPRHRPEGFSNQCDSGILPPGRHVFESLKLSLANDWKMPAHDIEAEAANWLIRLESDSSPGTRSEFEAWTAADSRNHAAFIRLETTWSRADILKKLRPLDGVVDEQVIDKFGAPVPIVEEPQKPRMRWLAVAASLVVAALGVVTWIVVDRSGWQTYATEFGGFQRVALADGSTAMLNTDSRIRVRITSSRREIVLDRGEALFTVAHDTHRPFDVSAGDTVVRAVGTAFSVRLRGPQQVDVIVTEGRVALDPPNDSLDAKLPQPVPLPTLSTLSAGETVSVKAHRLQQVRKIANEDVTRKLAWTQGRIWFDRVTLTEAVAEFNRYNRRQLVIDDPAIEELHIGGVFDATDLDSFVAALRTFGIRTPPSQAPADSDVPEVIRLVRAEPAH
jgi:transmembrane sensor